MCYLYETYILNNRICHKLEGNKVIVPGLFGQETHTELFLKVPTLTRLV